MHYFFLFFWFFWFFVRILQQPIYSKMKRRSFSFRQDVYDYCKEHTIDMQERLRLLMDKWIEEQKAEAKKIQQHQKKQQ